MTQIARAAAAFFILTVGAFVMAQESSGGHLVIVGGGLRPDNRAVFEKLVEFAGGAEAARFVVLPTASVSTVDSYDVCKYLTTYGVSAERSEVLLVTQQNAATSVANEAILAKVRAATGVFLSGGDQRRLVRLLTKADGSDTPLLAEIRNVYARGGVIGGTSAGASAQSATMLAVSGLHDILIDEGLDTLDFGITSHTDQRGLLLTRGFGFFKSGIVDQHFTQFRVRLGRLTRATADSGVPFGFGIDENTALLVASDGPIQIAGAGAVTIVKPGEARGVDGPCGYKISNVSVTMLSAGDTFDPVSGAVTIDPIKPLLVREKAEYDGNFLINDIAGGGAVPFALVAGLAENTAEVQEALSIKFHGSYMHGYRFTFRKRPTTEAYGGIIDEKWTYSVVDVQLDIVPIAAGLEPAEKHRSVDVPDGEVGQALTAIAFRGLMPADQQRKFRPDDAITRGEFACALARSAHLPASHLAAPSIQDLNEEKFEAAEIRRVVAAGWMRLDAAQRFEVHSNVNGSDAATALRKLVAIGALSTDAKLAKKLDDLQHSGDEPVTRSQIGQLLFDILLPSLNK